MPQNRQHLPRNRQRLRRLRPQPQRRLRLRLPLNPVRNHWQDSQNQILQLHGRNAHHPGRTPNQKANNPEGGPLHPNNRSPEQIKVLATEAMVAETGRIKTAINSSPSKIVPNSSSNPAISRAKTGRTTRNGRISATSINRVDTSRSTGRRRRRSPRRRRSRFRLMRPASTSASCRPCPCRP